MRFVATGESYKTKAGVKEGIEAVERAAANATIEDKTRLSRRTRIRGAGPPPIRL